MEYQLPRNSRKCSASGRPLEPGQEYYSVVRETITGLVREDYAADQWNGPPQDAIGFWKGTIPAAGPAKPKPITVEAMVGLFEELFHETDPDKQRLRYVLTLLLMRKRVFKLQDVERNADEEFLVLKVTPGYVSETLTPTIRVMDPQLSGDETSTVESELMALLATDPEAEQSESIESEATGTDATESVSQESESESDANGAEAIESSEDVGPNT